MKLVFIHGAPAAGKLTTARALLGLIKGRLFDNHPAIDVARTVFGDANPSAIQTQKEERAICLLYFDSYRIRELCDCKPTGARYI